MEQQLKERSNTLNTFTNDMCTHATEEEQITSNQSQQFIFDSQSNPLLSSLRCHFHSVPPPITKENCKEPSNQNQDVGTRKISSPCFGQHVRRKNYNRKSFLSSLHDIDQLNGSVEILDQSGLRTKHFNQWDLYELFLGNNNENSNWNTLNCNGSNKSLFNDVFHEKSSVILSNEALARGR